MAYDMKQEVEWKTNIQLIRDSWIWKESDFS